MKVCDKVRCILDKKGYEVWFVAPDASVYEAIEMMADRRVGALPVAAEGKLVGMISERDYARKVVLKSRSSRETLVSEIMTRSLITVTPDTTVDESMRLMNGHRVRHLPVLRGEQLVGMLSLGDLVNWIIDAQDAAIDQLEHYIAGAYPG